MRGSKGRRATLETGERLFLRRLRASDEEELTRLRRESWSFLSPWEPAPLPGHEPWGSAWFQRQLRTARRRNQLRTLLCRADDDAILGALNANEIVRGAFHSTFVGYWIGAPHARQGFMSEGLALLLRHLFETEELHRVEANIRPENLASIALVRRLGFSREGFSPRYLRIDGAWRDHERWALLAEDWTALRGRPSRSG